MSKLNDRVVWKDDGKTENLYLLNVPVIYAVVHEPRQKYQSDTEMEYQATVFVDKEVRDYLLDEVKINKSLPEVGVDKTKKRTIKYPLSSQGGGDTYDPYEGMCGLSLTCPSKSKAGKDRFVKVVDDMGMPFTEKLGNGTVISVKLFGYRNQEGLLNIQMTTIKVVDHVPYEEREDDGDDILGIGVQSDLPL